MTLRRKFSVRLLSLVLGPTITASVAAAQPDLVPAHEAAAVANNWLHLGQEMKWGWDGAGDFRSADAQKLIYKGEVVGYAFLAESGYVAVPSCRELPPITAYSTTSPLDVSDEEGWAGLLMEALSYKEELVRTYLNMSPPPAEWQPLQVEIERNRNLWRDYVGSYPTFVRRLEDENRSRVPRGHGARYAIDDISPLLATSWNRNSPYNDSCPASDSGHCVTGCIATACSQILFYWRYPVCGFGTHSYYWDGDQSCGHNTPGQILTVDFADGYDWANMLNSYGPSATPAQRAAVAELCYEAGVAIDMDYGTCQSWDSTYYVMESLPLYFGYSGDIHRENRGQYASADTWFQMLRGDLDRRWPLQYRVIIHSMVCDGWRIAGTNQIHMNYGMGGSHTDWYTVDNLYCPWPGCDFMVEYCIRGIRPSTSFSVTVPNGGESYPVGTEVMILWDPANYFENVRIELSRSYPGGAGEILAENTPNDGNYAWTVSTPVSASARIRVVGTQHSFLSDTSDASFSIVPPVGMDCTNFDTLLFADHDAHITAAYPTHNYGRRDSVVAGQSSNLPYYALFHFDLSGLDSGVTIASAVCSLYVNSSYGSPLISCYRINSDWFEGRKMGSPADTNECCWYWRGCGTGSVTNGTVLRADMEWNSPIMGPTACDSVTVVGTGWFHWNVPALVQLLADAGPASASGIGLYSPWPGINSWCRFNSRDFTNRPRLRVKGFRCVSNARQSDLTVVAQLEDGHVRLHWTNTHAPSYNVYTGSYVGGPDTLMATTTDTFLTVCSVDTAAAQKFYQVRANLP